ncbi:MAG: c-type cytochrome [Proteobacteria bacterium]|nr:c-type cytochrome [Pseudomonadota bacterium]
MSTIAHKRHALSLLVATALLAPSLPASAVDADAAQVLARQSGCFKCHAVDRKKDGPAWRDVAAKYAGDAGAEAKLIHHITSGEKAKFDDGHEEEHKIVKSNDAAQIKNLIDWILSLPGGAKP